MCNKKPELPIEAEVASSRAGPTIPRSVLANILKSSDQKSFTPAALSYMRGSSL